MANGFSPPWPVPRYDIKINFTNFYCTLRPVHGSIITTQHSNTAHTGARATPCILPVYLLIKAVLQARRRISIQVLQRLQWTKSMAQVPHRRSPQQLSSRNQLICQKAHRRSRSWISMILLGGLSPSKISSVERVIWAFKQAPLVKLYGLSMRWYEKSCNVLTIPLLRN